MKNLSLILEIVDTFNCSLLYRLHDCPIPCQISIHLILPASSQANMHHLEDDIEYQFKIQIT